MTDQRFHHGFTTSPPGSLYRHSKTGGVYWKVAGRHAPAELRQKGKQFLYVPMVPARHKVATKSMQIGDACRRALWLKWQKARKADDVQGDSLHDWLERFERWNLLQASADHARYNRVIVARFIEHAKIDDAELITADSIEQYLLALKDADRSDRTLQAHVRTIKMFCRYLMAPRGPLVLDPSAQVRVAAPALYDPRYLSPDQQAESLEHIRQHGEPWIFDAVSLVLYAGARRGSLEALKVHHLAQGGLVVPLPKTRRSRSSCVVPFDKQFRPIIGPELPQLVQELRSRTDGQYVFPQRGRQSWSSQLARLTKDLPVFGELPGKRVGNRWHLLRSTCAVTWAARGATQWQLMDWGGWTDPKTVLRYVNIGQAARGMESPLG